MSTRPVLTQDELQMLKDACKAFYKLIKGVIEKMITLIKENLPALLEQQHQPCGKIVPQRRMSFWSRDRHRKKGS